MISREYYLYPSLAINKDHMNHRNLNIYEHTYLVNYLPLILLDLLQVHLKT